MRCGKVFKGSGARGPQCCPGPVPTQVVTLPFIVVGVGTNYSEVDLRDEVEVRTSRVEPFGVGSYSQEILKTIPLSWIRLKCTLTSTLVRPRSPLGLHRTFINSRRPLVNTTYQTSRVFSLRPFLFLLDMYSWKVLYKVI